MSDLLLGKLKSARESLCVAQVHVDRPSHIDELQAAIDTIDRLGVWYSGPERQWSEHDVPELDDPT